MLTNPNTCGLFERDVVGIAEAIHAAGAYFYADGANFNAIVGKVRPGDLGVDAMHINLHKTLHASRRRRPRRRAGGALGGARPVHAGALRGRRRGACATWSTLLSARGEGLGEGQRDLD